MNAYGKQIQNTYPTAQWNKDPHQIPTGSKQCACEKLESVVAIGLHKQTFPKTAYRYVLIVTCQDGKQTAIYRKLKEFKWFQNQLAVELSNCPKLEEASKYLAKHKKKIRTGLITSSMGTAQRLRLIDAINMYLEVVAHYLYDLNQFRILKYFLSPSPKDLEDWSENGKMFFYCGNQAKSCGKQSCGNAISRSQSTANLYAITKLPAQKQKLYRRRSASLTSSPPDDDTMYVASEDYVPRDKDVSFNVTGLNAGEKVQVLRKSETGWWFVKRGKKANDESLGYVPGSFLKPVDLIPITSSNEDARIKQDEPIYESLCYPLEHSPSFEEKKSTETQSKKELKNSETIPRYSDEDLVISSSLSHQEKIESSVFNRHKIRLQHLFANKV